jgi:hypothetical protein
LELELPVEKGDGFWLSDNVVVVKGAARTLKTTTGHQHHRVKAAFRIGDLDALTSPKWPASGCLAERVLHDIGNWVFEGRIHGIYPNGGGKSSQ